MGIDLLRRSTFSLTRWREREPQWNCTSSRSLLRRARLLTCTVPDSLSLSRYNGPNVRALRMPKYNQVMLSGWPLRADDRAPEIYCSVLMMHNAHSPISTVNREIGVRSTGTLLNTCWSTILPTVPDWPVHCRRRRVAIRGTISRCGNLRRWPRLRCTAPTLLGRPSPTGPPAPSAHFPPVPTLPLQTKKKKTKKKI